MYFQRYEKDYTEIAKTIISMFSPIEIGMVSMGTLTFIKPAIKSLRSLGIPSKVLQMPMADAAGKFSYPLEIKENIFKTVWNAFAPWHNKVFFIVCFYLVWQVSPLVQPGLQKKEYVFVYLCFKKNSLVN